MQLFPLITFAFVFSAHNLFCQELHCLDSDRSWSATFPLLVTSSVKLNGYNPKCVHPFRENHQGDINILRSATFVTDISVRFLKGNVILIFHGVAVDICNISLWDIPTFLWIRAENNQTQWIFSLRNGETPTWKQQCLTWLKCSQDSLNLAQRWEDYFK